ncbi:major coat protein [Vibrio ostreicida]|uniref:major coat protein n=1 Tax=Vibrio ostreicida TaxID=526588 RepID=UPI003B5BB6CB
MKKLLIGLKNRAPVVALGVVSLISGVAHAALGVEAQAAADALTGAATDYIAMAWGIVPIVVVGFIGIKLFRKSANKAT